MGSEYIGNGYGQSKAGGCVGGVGCLADVGCGGNACGAAACGANVCGVDGCGVAACGINACPLNGCSSLYEYSCRNYDSICTKVNLKSGFHITGQLMETYRNNHGASCSSCSSDILASGRCDKRYVRYL